MGILSNYSNAARHNPLAVRSSAITKSAALGLVLLLSSIARGDVILNIGYGAVDQGGHANVDASAGTASLDLGSAYFIENTNGFIGDQTLFGINGISSIFNEILEFNGVDFDTISTPIADASNNNDFMFRITNFNFGGIALDFGGDISNGATTAGLGEAERFRGRLLYENDLGLAGSDMDDFVYVAQNSDLSQAFFSYDIIHDAGNVGGNNADFFSVDFSSVPEPYAPAILVGLFALYAATNRRRTWANDPIIAMPENTEAARVSSTSVDTHAYVGSLDLKTTEDSLETAYIPESTYVPTADTAVA